MSVGLTEEQTLVADSVARFIQDQYEFNERRKHVATEHGFRGDHWSTFAELGWLALPFTESDGGLDGSLRDVGLIAEGLGRGLFVGPYMSSVVLAGGLVASAGSAEQKSRLLEPLMAGEHHLAFAFAEPQARYNLNDVATTATATASGFELNGSKSVVMHAPSASHFIVSARTQGERTDGEGVSLFVVDAAADGVMQHSYPTVDDHRASELQFSNTTAEPLGPLDQATPIIEAICDRATVVLCAEAVGCMGTLYESTLDYIKQREQFGAPIGSFQAIQHRMVDVFMSYEQVRSLAYATAARLSTQITESERARLTSALKFEVAKAGRHVGQEAIQLHGGMGMTDELPIGHYFKRLTCINATLGDRHYHLQRFRQLEG